MRAQHASKRSLLTDALIALAGLLASGPVSGCASSPPAQQPVAAPSTVAVPAPPSTAAPTTSDGTTMVEPGVDEPPASPAPPAATDTEEPVAPPPRPIQVKYGGPSGA